MKRMTDISNLTRATFPIEIDGIRLDRQLVVMPLFLVLVMWCRETLTLRCVVLIEERCHCRCEQGCQRKTIQEKKTVAMDGTGSDVSRWRGK